MTAFVFFKGSEFDYSSQLLSKGELNNEKISGNEEGENEY
jgi:hypothetical protein